MKRSMGISAAVMLFGAAALIQSASAATLSSLRINPESPAPLLAGQTLRLSVDGNYSGETKDVTSKVSWTVSDKSLILISADGLVTMVSSGETGMPGAPPNGGPGQPPGGGMGGPPSAPPSGGMGPGSAPPSGGAPPNGGPGGGMPQGRVVAITAALDGVVSPALSLTV